MGLDLMLVKGTHLDKDNSALFDDSNELCYGRKTWCIANFFMERSQKIDENSDYLWRVPLSTWNEFVNYVKSSELYMNNKIGDILDRWWEDGEELGITEDEYNEVVEFVNDLSDGYPTLGYDWEARTMIDWVAQDSCVQEVFKEDPNSVYLIVSY